MLPQNIIPKEDCIANAYSKAKSKNYQTKKHATASPRTVHTMRDTTLPRMVTNDRNNELSMSPRIVTKKGCNVESINCRVDTMNRQNNESKFNKDEIHDRYNQCSQQNRGRCDEMIDLTNLREPATPIRKRSKSPIRLFGDPPIPKRMDGSPIHRSMKHTTSNIEQDLLKAPNSPIDVHDNDLTILQDILSRRDDLMDLIVRNSPSNQMLGDGSKVVMVKPTINVYKIQNDDNRPTSPWRDKNNHRTETKMNAHEHNHSPIVCTSPIVTVTPTSRNRSPKVSLKIRTVLNVDDIDVNDTSDNLASPVVTVSLNDDDSSIDDELRKLAASEKLLRKELEEVQKRSAVRRWEIDDNTAQVQTRKNVRAIEVIDDDLYDEKENVASSPTGDVLNACSLIDLSCIDVELEDNQPLLSPLPVASAYYTSQEAMDVHITNSNNGEHGHQIYDTRIVQNDFNQRLGIDHNQITEPFMKARSLSPKSQGNGVAMPSSLGGNNSPIPTAISRLGQGIWNFYERNQPFFENKRNVDRSPRLSNSIDSHGLYVPSLSDPKDNSLPKNKKRLNSGVKIAVNSSRIVDEIDGDVLLDRDFSWGAIEKLYQLSIRSESCGSNNSTQYHLEDHNVTVVAKDLEIMNRANSPEVLFEVSSNETNGVKSIDDPIFRCIEQPESLRVSYASRDDSSRTTRSVSSTSDQGHLSDIETLEIDTLDGTDTNQSIYATLLQSGPRIASDEDKIKDETKQPNDPQSSRRLQSLLQRHKYIITGDTNGNINEVENNEMKAQGIYAELVRRTRHSSRVGLGSDRTQSNPIQSKSDSNNGETLPKSPISAVIRRYAWQSSPVKRLERLRKLHREMKERHEAEQEMEKESHFSHRLSPARRRATKSLRRKAVTNQPKNDTPRLTTNNMTTFLNDSRLIKDGVVQVYMTVTGSNDTEVRKPKKRAKQTSRDHISLASSTRSNSHSLVNSLPSTAKARSVVSGKPGRYVKIRYIV
jgi:hypothetical protein